MTQLLGDQPPGDGTPAPRRRTVRQQTHRRGA